MADWRAVFDRWKTDYDFKTFLNSAGTLPLTTMFALYNGYLGLRHGSSWYRSICVYYLLLVLIRSMIVLAEKKSAEYPKIKGEKLRRHVYTSASVALLILNIWLIQPIALLVKHEKPVNITLIPAIAMAAYSFYKITLASVNLKKREKSANCLVRLLRSINFIDALMSIMSLQNTLIIVASDGSTSDMMPVSAGSSAFFWLAAVVLSVSGLVKNKQ